MLTNRNNIKALKQKIFTLPELVDASNEWKRQGEKVVFTNGCFDLIHLGHVDYLANAADIGHKFIIGVNSDDSVSRLKGKHRPIKDQLTRLMVLAAFQFVDALVVFDQDTPEQLIKEITPNYLVKGGDYKVHEIVGGNHVMKNGGSVVIIPFIKGHSTTLLESKIKAC